jgi:hypothetical protein
MKRATPKERAPLAILNGQENKGKWEFFWLQCKTEKISIKKKRAFADNSRINRTPSPRQNKEFE